MIMPQGLRKAMLTAHVIASVGWLGAVVAFLALALTGTMSQDPQVVRAVYLIMDVTMWWTIVPLALLGLVTGIISSLFTKWGLFRYYWVLIKLVVTVAAMLIGQQHAQATTRLAGVAEKTVALGSTLFGVRSEMVTTAAGGLAVLLLLTILSVYKPRGLTPYGQRKQDEHQQGNAASLDQVQESEPADASIPVKARSL